MRTHSADWFIPRSVYLVNLNVDGKSYNAVMKDLQFHPVTDRLQHIDFIRYLKRSLLSLRSDEDHRRIFRGESRRQT